MNAALSPLPSTSSFKPLDRRSGERKLCRVRAVFSVAGETPMPAKTLNVSMDGIALLIPMALPPGTVGEVQFHLYINGQLRQVAARVEVTNCVFVSESVRVGGNFRFLDAATKSTLTDFLR